MEGGGAGGSRRGTRRARAGLAGVARTTVRVGSRRARRRGVPQLTRCRDRVGRGVRPAGGCVRRRGRRRRGVLARTHAGARATGRGTPRRDPATPATSPRWRWPRRRSASSRSRALATASVVGQRAARRGGCRRRSEPPPAVGDAGVPGPSTSEAPTSRRVPTPTSWCRPSRSRRHRRRRSRAGAIDAPGDQAPPTRRLEELLAELDALVGLDAVKTEVRHQTQVLRIQALRGSPRAAQPRADAPPRVRRQPGNRQDHRRPPGRRHLPGRRPAAQGSPRRVRPLRARRRLRRPDRDQDRRT